MLGLKGFAQVESLYSGWEFRRGNEAWQAVSVPHDWGIKGPFNRTNDLQVTRIIQDGEKRDKCHTGRTGALPWIGQGEYRRTLSIPPAATYAELIFEGAMSAPTIFADGKKVGEWKNGYNAFIVPIPTSTREIRVMLDNPPASSRWYPGAGLIRPVRLVTGGDIGLATWGTYARTTALSKERGELTITSRIRGNYQNCTLSYQVLTSQGAIVAHAEKSAQAQEVSAVLSIAHPHAWSPESPTLYTLITTLSCAGVVCDRKEERVGLRQAYFTREGFFLNGVKRSFRGVCLHHDLGVIGAAFNAAAFRRQLRLLKELGVDALRTAHNMPAPDEMDICDEEGILVMAESFDMWLDHETPNDYARYFPLWWQRDLTNLIMCHRSHPCIVMWSIGNEIHETDIWRCAFYARELTALCKKLDPTRPVVFVTDRPDAYTQSGAIQETDIPALTYRLPRYGFMHEHSPIGLVLGAETASTFSSRGVYHFPDEVIINAEHPNGQASSYDLEHGSWSNLPDDDWAMQDDHPWAIGEFVWTGFDYLGEPTPYKEYWPSRSSYFGLYDLAGLPKDRAFLYRCRYRTDSPTLHILPHWTWPGREGLVTPVYVYTSYPEAELFVNGVSQGRRRRNQNSRLDRYRLRWREVRYAPGSIRVVAYDNLGNVAAEKTVETAAAIAAIQAIPERPFLYATPQGENGCLAMPDLGYIRIRLVDQAGRLCPGADTRITASVSGAAHFKGFCNGDPTSLEPFGKPTMKAFQGELVLTLEPGVKPDICDITLTAKNLPPCHLQIPIKARK